MGFDPDTYQFRQITIAGHFSHDQAVRVFTSLSDAKGKYDGAGYWVMTPFALDGGGTVFVNRGFVPQQVAATYIDDKAGPMGEQTLTGIGLESEAAGSFTPGPDGPNRIEWVRDISRLKARALAVPKLVQVHEALGLLPPS